ncbi:DUF2336 domain-containing protein [Methylocystis echinoides]|uniref:DUF2336 domain-containing protein n=1 Tax=Methylocystis echinoides TaxID=29468 RepID=UPI0034273C45
MQPDKSERRIDHAALLRAIVDQFVERQMHPVGDVKQFEQLALGLIDIVDADSAAPIVRPLCIHPETPASIFDCLLAKGGACAELALQFAPDLSHADLRAVAQGGPPALACAVARRGGLERDIVEALVQRGEAETLRALAANWRLRFEPAARRALAQAARDDLSLARILLDRDDFSADSEGLFLAATRHERTEIILNACRRALCAGMAERAAADPAVTTKLERAALDDDSGAMAAALAEALDCRKTRALAILGDVQGEALALALTALGVDADAASRIFLALPEQGRRAPTLAALVRAIPQRAAREIVAAMTGNAKGERETMRRAGKRDDLPSPPARRRVTPQGGSAPLRKADRA